MTKNGRRADATIKDVQDLLTTAAIVIGCSAFVLAASSTCPHLRNNIRRLQHPKISNQYMTSRLLTALSIQTLARRRNLQKKGQPTLFSPRLRGFDVICSAAHVLLVSLCYGRGWQRRPPPLCRKPLSQTFSGAFSTLHRGRSLCRCSRGCSQAGRWGGSESSGAGCSSQSWLHFTRRHTTCLRVNCR